MTDRISTQVLANGAIRYAEYDSAGNFVQYRYMLPADEPSEVGTPLNKATFLKDATASLFGFSGDPTVDDVLAWLGKLNEYAWMRRTVSIGQTNITSRTNFIYQTAILEYSNALTVVHGKIALSNPSLISITSANATTAGTVASLAPCYIKNNIDGKIYYIPTGTTSGGDYSKTIFYDGGFLAFGPSASVKAQIVTVSNYGECEFVYSTIRNAYPDSGLLDGYEYEYSGKPIKNASSKHIDFVPAQIETGSYVGTGTYGLGNPNTLSFNIFPKVVFVGAPDSSTSQTYHVAPFFVGSYGSNIFGSSSTGSMNAYGINYATFTDNAVSWYHPSSEAYQMNTSGRNYRYIAIG